MKRLNPAAIGLAEKYVTLCSRILERRRFAFLFGSGDAAGVLAALAPYRNSDGGYGNALEPDCQPGSQPIAVLAALGFLDEVGALGGELVDGICAYLVSVTAPDGGLPFVHPGVGEHPKAPWWEVPETYHGALIPTANIAGLLHKNKVEHPWLDSATEFCWRALDSMTDTNPYEVLAAVQFLDQAPDRGRASAAAVRLGRLARESGCVALVGNSADKSTVDGSEGFEDGELHFPHDYASTPDSLARGWFTDEEFEAGLDHLVESRNDDGSWPVRWGIWTPVTAFEWGGWVTIDALKILHAHQRLG